MRVNFGCASATRAGADATSAAAPIDSRTVLRFIVALIAA
jgi:hypothetical protein